MTKLQKQLEGAFRGKNADLFEVSLTECFVHGQLDGLCNLLIRALPQEWHTRHEDVVSAIQELRCSHAISALEKRAIESPDYLTWDTNLALSRKCLWALADIGTYDARCALERLATATDPLVREYARKRLVCWTAEMHGKGE